MKLKANTNGSILITSIWIMVILSVLAMGIGFRASVEARLAKYNLDRTKALFLAKAGIVKSRALLANATNKFDSIYENGITLSSEDGLSDVYLNVKLADYKDGYFSVGYSNGGLDAYPGMMDEERRININRVSEEVLKNLLQIVANKNKSVLGALTPDELAASIVLWRSPGPGADDSYYESLTAPYKCKHAYFSAIEELLFVKGMTADILNAIKDYVTVFGPDDGGININTASKEVLMAMGMTEALANKVVRFRNGSDGEAGTKDDEVFSDVSTVQLVLKTGSPDGLTDDETAIIGDLIGNQQIKVASNYFRIESRGIVNTLKIEKKIVCVVQRIPTLKGGSKLLSYLES